MAQAINAADKASRSAGVKSVKDKTLAALLTDYPERGRETPAIPRTSSSAPCGSRCWTKVSGWTDATWTPSGRSTSTPACCRVRTAPLVFTRGQTQGLVSVTLGTSDDEQRIDSIDVAGETTKSFMLHYNFPPYSTAKSR